MGINPERYPFLAPGQDLSERLTSLRSFIADVVRPDTLPVVIADEAIEPSRPLDPSNPFLTKVGQQADRFGMLEGIDPDAIYCGKVMTKAEGLTNALAERSPKLHRSLSRGKLTDLGFIDVSKKNEPLLRYRFSSQFIEGDEDLQGSKTFTVERLDDDDATWRGFTLVRHDDGNVLVQTNDIACLDPRNMPKETTHANQRESFELAETWLEAIAEHSGIKPSFLLEYGYGTKPVSLDSQREQRKKRHRFLIPQVAAAVAMLSTGILYASTNPTPEETHDTVKAYMALLSGEDIEEPAYQDNTYGDVIVSSNAINGNATTGNVSNNVNVAKIDLTIDN